MLPINGEKYPQCPCCKPCADCDDYKQTAEVEGAGLVIYQQIELSQMNTNEGPPTATSTGDIFILQHTKDKNLSMNGWISAKEFLNIDCPRCKYIIEHVRKRMQAVGYIEKNVVIGVCDHCRNKNNSLIQCYECEDIAKKFIVSFSENTGDTKQNLRTWLTKVKHLLKDARIGEEVVDNKTERLAHFPLQPSKLSSTKEYVLSPAKTTKTKFKASDKLEKNENISNSKPYHRHIYRTKSFDSYLQKLENIINIKGTLKFGKQYASKTDNIMSPVDPNGDTYYFGDKKYTRKPTDHQNIQDSDTCHLLDTKYMPKPDRVTLPSAISRYDSLHASHKRHTNTDEVKKFDLQGYNTHYRERKRKEFNSESSELTDINKYNFRDWQQKIELVTPFNEKIPLWEINSKRNLADPKKPINKEEKNKQHPKSMKLNLRETTVLTGSLHRAKSETSMLDMEKIIPVPKRIFKSVTELYRERNPNVNFMKSHDYIEHYVSSAIPRNKSSKEKNNIASMYYPPNKKYTSEEALSAQSEVLLAKDFSYQFPKETMPQKQPKRLRTSSELIRETQDMLNMKEEEKKQRIEIEHTKKILERHIKSKAREEKRRLHDEKKKDEEQKLIKKIEGQSRTLEEIRSKNDERLRLSAAKKKKGDGQVNVKEKMQLKLSEEEKQTVKEEKEKVKTEKEKSKDDKKKSLNEKLKENEQPKGKAKLEKVKKEKETADKESDKLKKEKEMQLRMQNEEKQREKEEKERLKREKEDQMRTEKDRTQGAKKDEEKDKHKTTKKGKNNDERGKVPELKQINVETPKNQQQKDINEATVEDFKKIRAKSYNKDEVSSRKKEAQLEKNARDEAHNKEREIEKFGKIHGKEAKAIVKPEPTKEMIKTEIKKDTPTNRELDIKQIKVRKPSYDDLILRLVKLKQSESKERLKQKQLPVLDMPIVAREHKRHKNTKASKCLMCIDSEFELDVESVLMKTDQPEESIKDIIIGQKIFKYKPLINKEDKPIVMPSLFQSSFQAESPVVSKEERDIVVKEETDIKPTISVPAKFQKLAEQEAPKGIIRYALSDRAFIEKGWTLLPTEKVVRKMNVYRMRPAQPEFDWFEHNKKKKVMLYDTGEKLADFDEKGRSRLYYKNGRLALDYYNAEEINAQQRFVVFSSGERDERGRMHPITMLATFDYLGNGIVFDHAGKIRLKYNQTEGVVLDRGIGPVSHWKWHTLNDPPVLQKVMIDTQMSHKDPEIYKMGALSDGKSLPDNEEMLAIEFDNFIKEKSKKLTQTFKPFQIKMKALKINDNFSLKILDQATIYLIFRNSTTNIKLNLGMILDHKEIVDTDTAEVGDVSNNLERFPARTESLAGLQRSVAYAQRFERARIERERRLRPLEPCTSADQLTAGATRPLRTPLRTAPFSSSSCKCSRKPCSSNVYYDTRLI